jgi:putative PEP-CTERM system histidine kinase
MLPFTVCYGLGCFSFLVLVTLMVVRHRPTGIGLGVLAVCLLTAAWAFAAAVQPWGGYGIAHVLDSVRIAAWLVLLAFVFVSARRADGTKAGALYTVIVPLIGLLAIANDLRFVFSSVSAVDFRATQIFSRIVTAVCGLLLVENLFRNTLPARRWHVFPLCIAVGGLFLYDLVVFSGAIITRGIDPVLLAGRGIVLMLIVPPLIVTMSRNQTWNIDIHVSRRIVFHTATLTIGGAFLIVAAGVAGFVGRAPGDWGALFRLTFFAGSIIALAMILSVSSLRSRLWRMLAENFFSSRYDYRAEWIRCISTLSATADRDPLQVRVIRALADVVDSPGGVLWLREPDGYFRVAADFNLNIGSPPAVPEAGAFADAFDGGKAVQVFDQSQGRDALPGWMGDFPEIWLAIPLVMSEEILGFVLLTVPRSPVTLNWESFDLLLTIGQQGASWLAEELAARALADSRLLIEYSTRFSFVAHDVKNVSSQLGIMIANMKQFGDQPEFRADMVKTMEASIQRLDGLLGKLKTGGQPHEEGPLDLDEVIGRVIQRLDCKSVIFERGGEPALCETIPEQDLQSVLTHVITNAVEASGPDAPVTVCLTGTPTEAVITIDDKGCGMDPAFVREQLFAPLRTTKRSGHGIGAFQARELVRAAGGTLDVTSVLQRGTSVRISLPRSRSATSRRRSAFGL